jgi:pyrimidine operon attenuation protein/uracil phosphoribosyltransferase
MSARDASVPTDATTEARDHAPDGAFFTPRFGGTAPMRLRTVVFDADTLRRSVIRIAHEIVERNNGAGDLVVVGLHTRGVPLAYRIVEAIRGFEGAPVAVGSLDIAFHRDDISRRPVAPLGPTDVPDVTDRVVVLVDDVLATGRTIRAALDAVMHLGRPRAVQLAVLVDRGHRELPIRADYVGKNLPTKMAEDVQVKLAELDGGRDRVELWAPEDPEATRRSDSSDRSAAERAGRHDERGS